MAMNGTTLGTAIAAAVGVVDPVAVAHFVTLATVIVAHIQTNAVVSTTDTVPGTGLAAPPGGGPVTGVAAGTGTGTIA